MTTALSISVRCDSSPILLFAELLKRAMQTSERPFGLGDFTFEPCRVESDYGAAATGELLVTLYPSDAFLRFAAAHFAGDFNLGAIEESGHDGLHSVK